MNETQIVAPPGTQQVVMTREFDAPAELLFRAHTEPDLLAQWLGPRGLTMIVDHFDARHGGTWRYIHRNAEGDEQAFHGVFHNNPSVEDGVIQTFEWEGMPDLAGHVLLTTITFEARGRKTLVRAKDVYQSVEGRDTAMESGMVDGIEEGNERLDELLARLVLVS